MASSKKFLFSDRFIRISFSVVPFIFKIWHDLTAFVTVTYDYWWCYCNFNIYNFTLYYRCRKHTLFAKFDIGTSQIFRVHVAIVSLSFFLFSFSIFDNFLATCSLPIAVNNIKVITVGGTAVLCARSSTSFCFYSIQFSREYFSSDAYIYTLLYIIFIL